MKNRLVWLAAGVVLAVFLGALPLRPAGAQPLKSVAEKTRLLAQAPPLPTSGMGHATGAGLGEVRIPMRKLWAAAIGVPGQKNSGSAYLAYASISAGAPIPGARVWASLDLGAAQGQVTWTMWVMDGLSQPGQATGSGAASAHTHVELTTPPFTLQAGHTYLVGVRIEASCDSGAGCECAYLSATVKDLKWMF